MSKTYKGKYKLINPEKYRGDKDNIIFRSGWERYAFKWCDTNKDIVEWSSEEIVISYYYEASKRMHRYFPDLYYKTKKGKKYLIEIKPAKETVPPTGKKRTTKFVEEGYTWIKNQNKWEAAEEWAIKHGMEFHVWTEKELQGLGIMPKTFGKVPGNLPKAKPFRPFKKPKRKS